MVLKAVFPAKAIPLAFVRTRGCKMLRRLVSGRDLWEEPYLRRLVGCAGIRHVLAWAGGSSFPIVVGQVGSPRRIGPWTGLPRLPWGGAVRQGYRGHIRSCFTPGALGNSRGCRPVPKGAARRARAAMWGTSEVAARFRASNRNGRRPMVQPLPLSVERAPRAGRDYGWRPSWLGVVRGAERVVGTTMTGNGLSARRVDFRLALRSVPMRRLTGRCGLARIFQGGGRCVCRLTGRVVSRT